MDKLAQACALSNKEWADALPKDIPNYSFSKAHNKKMQKLIRRMHGDKYRSTSKNTLRIILVAAVIVSLSVVAFSITATPKREYYIQKFSDHSIYGIKEYSGYKKIKDFKIGFLPEEFEFVDKFEDEVGDVISYEYSKTGTNGGLVLDKEVLTHQILFDTEDKNCEKITISDIDYYVVTGDEKYPDYIFIIWNTDEYIYSLGGNVKQETALKIAQNMK